MIVYYNISRGAKCRVCQKIIPKGITKVTVTAGSGYGTYRGSICPECLQTIAKDIRYYNSENSISVGHQGGI